MTIENQRLLDLVRVCRAELFLDHKLITEEEYAWLATLRSKETHARLDDYDDLRAKLQEATRARDNWRAELKAEVEPLQAECHRLKRELAERQKTLEAEMEGRASAFAERNWANERHDEVRAYAAQLREAAEYGQKAAEERGIMQGLDYWRRKGEEWKALLAEPLLTPKS